MTESILTGIKIVDLSFWLPGPYCSCILADLGAEVIKVERHLMGDPMRLVVPHVGGESCAFMALNRNKKSLALNLRRPEGMDVLLKLATTADVLLEGFRPGRVEQLGIGYESVRRVNPRIVYCSLSGFGQEGSRAYRSGHDITYAALAGLFDLFPPGGPPVLPALQLADLSGALFATIGILAALVRRGVGGAGAYLDVDMFESTVGLLGPPAAALLCGQVAVESVKLLAGRMPGYHLYRTRDGRWMALGTVEPVFWADFCRALGREDLVGKQFPEKDEAPEIVAELQRLFAGRSQDEWIRFFADKDLCCKPVLSLEEALAQPQLRERGMITCLDHPTAGSTVQIGLPIQSGGERRAVSPSPLLGQHTVEIMHGLGYSEREIDRLRRRRVVTTAETPLASGRRMN